MKELAWTTVLLGLVGPSVAAQELTEDPISVGAPRVPGVPRLTGELVPAARMRPFVSGGSPTPGRASFAIDYSAP